MSDPLIIGYLEVAGTLDKDGEVEFEVNGQHVWLDKWDAKSLINHLADVFEMSSEEAAV